MFKKVLIANRGEIAVRIAQTLQQMGIRVVAIYSDADRRSPHVIAADEAVPLEGNAPRETYLRGERILEIARAQAVDAIHPGYGFLSENAEFAEACGRAGVTFIGPTPQVIRAMGDKIAAKATMERAGVPVVPGWSGAAEAGADADALKREAARIGYPLLVKAAAGGGGKGMRRVAGEAELIAAFEAAAREAASAFGNARVFLEKYIDRPRHVEFQIFGDAHGEVVHLFERECSIQRRYQKIIEETPSTALSSELRARMGEAAVRAGRALGYRNAGTVEFIVDPNGAFYFLEVNTRLQVEHPVTEMTVHRDLVRAQITVAAGERLPFTQDTLRQEGHSLQCRVYAEDPSRNFMPSIGTLLRYRPPQGPGIRVDSGVTEGGVVSVYYDPLLAKLIVWGRTRTEALRRMRWALDRFVVLGVTTNLPLLRRVIEHRDFEEGRLHTHFLTEHTELLNGEADPPPEAWIAAALAHRDGLQTRATQSSAEHPTPESPWTAGRAWRAH